MGGSAPKRAAVKDEREETSCAVPIGPEQATDIRNQRQAGERRRHARCRLVLSSFELGLATSRYGRNVVRRQHHEGSSERTSALSRLGCLLYTSDAADEEDSVDL